MENTSKQQVATPATRDKLAEALLPINRSGWAVAAGYVALFSFPFILPALFAIILGIIALFDLRKHPQRAGAGRAWFAIIYGGAVVALVAVFLLTATWG